MWACKLYSNFEKGVAAAASAQTAITTADQNRLSVSRRWGGERGYRFNYFC
jgi:hypothetical protein